MIRPLLMLALLLLPVARARAQPVVTSPELGPAQISPPQAPPPAAPAPSPQTPAPAWIKRDAAQLDLLDKITARVSHVRVPIGQSVRFGTLTVAVQACEIRPPDRVPDAAAYLVITDSNPGAPGFQGWILHSEPELSTFQHPVYDVNLAGCD